jgi:hypothetical protein
MKVKLLFPALTLAVLIATAIQAARVQETEQTEKLKQELIKLDKDWGDAVASKNVAALEQILAEDFIGVGSKGEKYVKADELNQLKNQTPLNAKYSSSDYEVRSLSKETALMLHHGTFSGQEGGKDVFEAHRSLHVFVKRDGRWWVVASDATPIPQE